MTPFTTRTERRTPPWVPEAAPFIKCVQKPCEVDLTLSKLQIRKGRGSTVSNDKGDSG